MPAPCMVDRWAGGLWMLVVGGVGGGGGGIRQCFRGI